MAPSILGGKMNLKQEKNQIRFDFYYVKAIFDTLPIGFYLKRRIKTILSEKSESSYFDPIADEITVSYPMIKRALNKVEGTSKFTGEKAEEIIRGLLFHEISHVILTAKNIFENCSNDKLKHDIRNIFEDERIETLLKNYYLLTNFKENVRIINSLSEEEMLIYLQTPSENALQEFYKIVRFRKKSKFSKRVSEIIENFKYLKNSINPDYTIWLAYTNAIDKLYEDVAKDFNNPPEQQSGQNQNNDSNGSGGQSSDEIQNDKKSQNGSEKQNNSNGQGDNSKCQSGEKTDGLANGAPQTTADKTPQSIVDDGYDNGCGLTDIDIDQMLKGFINQNLYQDSKLFNEISKILSLAEKHNKEAEGSHFSQVSGRFSPKRYLKSENCDYFIRKKGEHNQKRKNGIELNLYIDASGSFSQNTNTIRKLLHTLSRLENINKKFSFNVCAFGPGQPKVLAKGNRLFTATGGSDMKLEMQNIIKDFQNKDKNNFNIVLMDGSFCNSQRFCFFNDKTFTVISDPANDEALRIYAPRAKTIICTDYCGELIKKILEVLKYYLTI